MEKHKFLVIKNLMNLFLIIDLLIWITFFNNTDYIKYYSYFDIE